MTELDLVALSDAGYHAIELETALRSGGDVEQSAGMLHIAGTHEAPFIVNGSMRVDAAVTPETAIAAARDWAARRGRVAGMSTHGQDADLEVALKAAGWQRIVQLPGMVAVDPIEEAKPGPGIRLETVRDERQLRTLVDLLGEAFGPEEPWPSLWASLFHDLSTIDRPDTTAVLGYADDQPAAAAVGYALHPVGIVGMVGALSRFGGRSLGNLVTRHVAAAAQRHTGRPVVLQSSPLARPMYERIGFRPVTTYGIWADGEA